MHYLINGMTIRRETNWELNVPIMAFADVELPEIGATIKGVMLGYRDGKFIACAPTKKENERGIYWGTQSEWSHRLGADLYDLYRCMGGEKPPGRADGKPAGRSIVHRGIKHKGDVIDAAMEAVEAELAEKGGSLMDAMANVYDRQRLAGKEAIIAECDKAVANAKRKGRPVPVPVKTVEEIDATMPPEEMGLNLGVARTLGLAS
jgi:hypothetical protein